MNYTEIKELISESIYKLFNIKCTPLHIELTNLVIDSKKPITTVEEHSTFGNYQSNICFSLSKRLKEELEILINPIELANSIANYINLNSLDLEVQSLKGFLNFFINNNHLVKYILNKDKSEYLTSNPRTIVVDYSSPNIAKEMHVGHLRSTIIGEFLCNLLELRGHKVTRVNHIGDYGTPIGMLIALIKDLDIELESLDISTLAKLYIEAKVLFDKEPEFKTKAKEEVINIQKNLNSKSIDIWEHIKKVSIENYKYIYNLLGSSLVNIDPVGESFYGQYIPLLIDRLKDKTSLSDNCICLFNNKEEIPLILTKSDGAYTYDTTDIAALDYRINKLKANRIIYVTDSGQSKHFSLVFDTKSLLTNQEVELVHIPFGLINDKDGKKLKSRAGKAPKLKDLIEQAIELTSNKFPSTDKNIQERIAIYSVIYNDLKQNRLTSYNYDPEEMLSINGNTAPYILYGLTRIQSILKRCNDLEVNLSVNNELLPIERTILTHIYTSKELLDRLESELKPNLLCRFLYSLSRLVNVYYEQYRVIENNVINIHRASILKVVYETMKDLLALICIYPVEHM